MNPKKESTTNLPKLKLMARDETLRSMYARNAPYVIPEWFVAKEINGRPEVKEDVLGSFIFPDGFFEWDKLNDESKWVQWREHYADLMIKHFGK